MYSAGIVLFEMLTGRVPYDGARPVDVAWQHVQHDVPAPSRFTPGLPPVLDDLVARATRRDPGGRPTDAGAMLAEVQAAREDVGLAVTTRSAPLAGPTVAVPRIDPTGVYGDTTIVPSLHTDRPGWARLNDDRPQPARAAAAAGAGGLAGLIAKVNAHPRGRLGLAAALVVMGLLAAIGGYWFGIGRYTEAPEPGREDEGRGGGRGQGGRLHRQVRPGPVRREAGQVDQVLRAGPGSAARASSAVARSR